MSEKGVARKHRVSDDDGKEYVAPAATTTTPDARAKRAKTQGTLRVWL